jgi:uncharacterized protein (DUF934 family)
MSDILDLPPAAQEATTGWRLNSDGQLSASAAPDLDLLLTPEAFEELGLDNLLQLERIGLVFKSAHDGRGFSLARRLRNEGFSGQIWGLGQLMPDQARHALQSGLDGLWLEATLVERHSEAAWRAALNVVAARLYSQQRLPSALASRLAGPDIWQQRAQTA